jgi:hypothetical protein
VEVNRVLVARYDRVDRRILPRPHVMIWLNLDNKREVDELYQRLEGGRGEDPR